MPQNMKPMRLILSDNLPQDMNQIPVEIDGLDERIEEVATGSGHDHPVTYYQYIATLSQTGTSAPVATVLVSTFPQAISWAYSSIGTYTAFKAGGVNFSLTRTLVIAGPIRNAVGVSHISASVTGAGNPVQLNTYNVSDAAANDMLLNTYFELREYL